MKSNIAVAVLLAMLGGIMLLSHSSAAENRAGGAVEYVTIHWDGKDNTHIIRPGGQVEFIGSELRKAVRPQRADERAFYMNVAMNGLIKEGYEFAGMADDDIVMKRAAK